MIILLVFIVGLMLLVFGLKVAGIIVMSVAFLIWLIISIAIRHSKYWNRDIVPAIKQRKKELATRKAKKLTEKKAAKKLKEANKLKDTEETFSTETSSDNEKVGHNDN